MEFRVFLFLLSGFFVITVRTEEKGDHENVFKEMYIAKIREFHIKSKSSVDELVEVTKRTILFMNDQAQLELTNLERHITEGLDELCTEGCEPLIKREYIKSIANGAKLAIDICINENTHPMRSIINQTLENYNNIIVIHNSLLDRWIDDKAEETFTEDNVVELLEEVEAEYPKVQENFKMVVFHLNRFLKCIQNITNAVIKHGVSIFGERIKNYIS